MKSKNSLTIALALSILPLSVYSESITPDEALQRLSTSKHNRIPASAASSLSLAISPEMLYVFTSADGDYIVASADDCGPAVLGYGEDFDAGNIPPAMAGLFEDYAKQIDWLSKNPQKIISIPIDNMPVSPLIKTKWNQSSPYNDLCPLDGSARSVTGCVATAMAQVVNYHQWPAKNGYGTHSYTWNGQNLSFDYSKTVFDWQNMSNTYTSSSSEKSKTAVATLMKACGYAVNMEYSSEESGAQSFRLTTALVDNFGYDKGIAYLMREYFTASEWNDIIYNELEEGRPVLFGGNNEESGHQFICDGYKGNGYFHINWGWGGKSDGYFLLSALDPYSQGIGGSNSGYNSGQDIVIGVRPPVEGSELFMPLYSHSGLEWDSYYNAFSFGKYDEDRYKGYFNYSANALTYQVAIKLEDNKGNTYYSFPETKTLEGCGKDGLDGHTIIRPVYPDFPAGEYKASPVVRLVGNKKWQPIRIPVSENQYLTVRKGNNGAITHDGSDPELAHLPLRISDIQQLSDWFTGQEIRFSLYVNNSSNSPEKVSSTFFAQDAKTGEVFNIGTWTIEYEANESRKRTFKMSSFELPEGEYLLRAIDKKWSAYISDSYRIFVGVRPTSIQIQQGPSRIEVGQSSTLSVLVLPVETPFKAISWKSSDEAIATVDANGRVTGLSQGNVTIAATSANGLESSTAIEVVASAGINEAQIDRNSPVDVYSMSGIKIRASVSADEATLGLAPGIYILRQNGAAMKIAVN